MDDRILYLEADSNYGAIPSDGVDTFGGSNSSDTIIGVVGSDELIGAGGDDGCHDRMLTSQPRMKMISYLFGDA